MRELLTQQGLEGTDPGEKGDSMRWAHSFPTQSTWQFGVWRKRLRSESENLCHGQEGGRVLGNIKGLESKRLEIWAFKSAKFKGQERGEGAEKWAWHLAPAFPPGIWQVVWSKRLWG